MSLEPRCLSVLFNTGVVGAIDWGELLLFIFCTWNIV